MSGKNASEHSSPGISAQNLTRDFLDLRPGRFKPFATFMALYDTALGKRERDGLDHVMALAGSDILGLQAFFQRKRSLLGKALQEAGQDFAAARLCATRSKPHRAGLCLPSHLIHFS